MRAPSWNRGFTLIELLVVTVILGILVALSVAVLPGILASADRPDSMQKLRGLHQAMTGYAIDNGNRFPGPLWPGQVPQFDPNREGRLVRELADYLGIERTTSPYVVESFIPRAYRRAMSNTPMQDVRVYVMRTAVTQGSATLRPFGSLTGTVEAPLNWNAIHHIDPGEDWMMAEADQQHPAVSSAPWANATPPQPVHRGKRAVLSFNGAVSLE
jgi:prepilin-type N-terminal cleavage/methylation domain-containing protein